VGSQILYQGFFDVAAWAVGVAVPRKNGPNPYYDVQDSVSYLLGKHTVKFGGEFARIETDSKCPRHGAASISGAAPPRAY